MALYLVVHTPVETDDTAVLPPSSLLELAQASVADGASPRWLRTWSPDLHDDRVFSLWEAANAADITVMMGRFGYLDHMEAQPLRVQEWGPTDVLAEYANASEVAG